MSDCSADDRRVAVESGAQTISLDQRLHALESVVRLIEWPLPHIRDQRTWWELSRVVDGLLTNVARGRGALELAIGECLEALAVGDRVFDLGGYCNVPDYARERHGIPASTAAKLMRFSREMRERPLLRAAVREGKVSVSQAEAVLPVATGDDERLWVARACSWTVRRLLEEAKKWRASQDRPGHSDEAAVSEVTDSGGGATTPSADAGASATATNARVGASSTDGTVDDRAAEAVAVVPRSGEARVARGVYSREEGWTRLIIDLPPGGQEIVDEGNALARQALERPGAPKWQLIQAVLDEFFASGCGAVHDAGMPLERRQDEPRIDLGSLEVLGESLDDQCAYWAALVQVPNVEAPYGDVRLMREPRLIDETLRRHVTALRRWDVLFGHLALVSKAMRCWWIAGFASFEHYCVERLGMALRTVEQRIALEERLHELPALRAAMDDGRISYEKARIIAANADRTTVEVRIEEARRMTCVSFRRRIEADEEAQMSARRKFKAVVPRSVAADLHDAFHVLRERAGAPLPRGECLVALYAHFISVWKPLLARRMTVHKRVLERDGYRCQVPGCSRTASHAHHIQLRSQGGRDEMSNLISLCVAHHLRGVHQGRIGVVGKAPDQLVWKVTGALPEIEGRWCESVAAA